jgi:hypothetical protein
MNPGTVTLLLLMALLMAGTLTVYERLLAQVRAERDDLLDVLDANIDDMRRLAQQRHPSSQQYGGGNLRLIAGGE